MTGRVCTETWSAPQMHGGSTSCGMRNDPNQPEAGPSDCKMHRNESSHEANDPLLTVDAGDRPHGASLPHKSAGQSSKHVVALAPWLRRQVDVVDPQECKEPQARDSSDAPEARGDLWTHVPSKATQGTPLVVPDMHRPAMDDMGIAATSHGSGVENGTTRVPLCNVKG